MNANVYQHFRKDEHPFVDSVNTFITQVENQYAPYLTDFLDPRQAYILETLVRQNSELQYKFYGGYEQAERTRCLIYPDYYQATQEDFQIQPFEIIYATKYATLSHGKILGSAMGIGIKRECFGDIISDGQRWQIFVSNEMAHFVSMQMNKIGKVSVRIEKIMYTELIVPKDEWILETTTTNSLRLDAIISKVYAVSRQRSKQLIESGKVKVNWSEQLRPDFLLDLLDIVSIRGFGRIQIQELEGRTKKDKLRLSIGVLRK